MKHAVPCFRALIYCHYHHYIIIYEICICVGKYTCWFKKASDVNSRVCRNTNRLVFNNSPMTANYSKVV